MIEMVGGPPRGQNKRHMIPKGKENSLWQREGKSEEE